MKILSASQIREADKHTIENEPISSLDLMERAAINMFQRLEQHYHHDRQFHIFCGMGNNGGDGLVLARLLSNAGYQVQVWVIRHSDSGSDDFQTKLKRLEEPGVPVTDISSADEIKGLPEDAVVVDAILGSGLSRPLKGLIAEVVQQLKKLPNTKVAIDIPTGLFADDNSENDLDKILPADLCLSLQFPKLSMLHKDTAPLCGELEVVDIGLSPEYIGKAKTTNYFVTKEEVGQIFKPRKKFSHKGTYGHGLLVAGSRGSLGAAVMSASGALRSGIGLLTVAVPGRGEQVLHSQLPEAMLIPDPDPDKISVRPEFKKANATAVGPGLGKDPATAQALKNLIQTAEHPMVFDADALNILSENKTWLSFLPDHSLLTPHPGEFKRLLGDDELESNYLERLRQFAMKNGIICILKDSITIVADYRSNLYFLDFGSPALASGGSGDVLTGILLGLLGQGYSPLHAALLGVYLQGTASKIAAEKQSLESCLAGDVLENIGAAYRSLY